MAGIWFIMPLILVPIAIAWLVMYIGTAFDENWPPKSFWQSLKFIGNLIGALLGGFLISWAIVNLPYVLGPNSGNFISRLGYNALKPAPFLFAIIGCAIWIWMAFPGFSVKEGSSWYEHFKLWLPFILVASLEMFFFFWYLGFFATTLYPNIAAELGGGQPINVQFIIKDDFKGPDSVQIRKILGMTDFSTRSPSLKLLLITNNSYFIEMPNQSKGSIELPRNIVSLALFGSQE